MAQFRGGQWNPVGIIPFAAGALALAALAAAAADAGTGATDDHPAGLASPSGGAARAGRSVPHASPASAAPTDDVVASKGSSGKGHGAGVCTEHKSPYPVNIVPHKALQGKTSIRLSYGVWNSSDVVVKDRSVSEHGLRLDLRFSDFAGGGDVQVGASVKEHDEYVLRSIRVRAPSEHTFLGRRVPLEVQLWHEPALQRDLRALRAHRAHAQAKLASVAKSLLRWEEEATDLQRTVSTNNSFPSLRTEQQWVAGARHRAADRGEEALLQALHLQELLGGIERRLQLLVDSLERPRAARRVVLSLLLQATDNKAVEFHHPTLLLRWITRVARGEADAVNARDISTVYRELGTDGGHGVQRAFGYEGSLPWPQCTPVVRWFVASEPLPIYLGEALRLMQPSLSDAAVRGGSNIDSAVHGAHSSASPNNTLWHLLTHQAGVWSGGYVKDTDVAPGKPLPNQPLRTCIVSADVFVAAGQRLSTDSVTNLSWNYIRFYCAVFLGCAFFMLCMTCGLWAQQCLDK